MGLPCLGGLIFPFTLSLKSLLFPIVSWDVVHVCQTRSSLTSLPEHNPYGFFLALPIVSGIRTIWWEKNLVKGISSQRGAKEVDDPLCMLPFYFQWYHLPLFSASSLTLTKYLWCAGTVLIKGLCCMITSKPQNPFHILSLFNEWRT